MARSIRGTVLVLLALAPICTACANLTGAARTPLVQSSTVAHPAALPPVVIETRSDEILRKVRDARAYCGGIDAEPAESDTGQRIVLCGTPIGSDDWRTVIVHFDDGRAGRRLTVETPGCVATHLGGTGPVRFHADVWCDGTKVVIYRARHFVSSLKQIVGYTPYHDADLFDNELAYRGLTFLDDVVASVRSKLRNEGVHSRTFPDALVSDLPFADTVLALAAIEQADHGAFAREPERTIKASYINYALNRNAAFALACSRAGACGPLQFTRGTYADVRAAYPRAHLIPDFLSGARDLRNAVKAAILLLDLELSYLPSEVHALMRVDPVRVGALLAAAYNGGARASRFLYRRVQASAVSLAHFDVDQVPRVFQTHRGRRNTETPVFVRKFFYTSDLISAWRARAGDVL